MSTLDQEIADLNTCYIVENGTSGLWKYRKWSDGTAECWMLSNDVTLSFSSWGTMYEAPLGSFNFPSGLFIDIPCVSAQAIVKSGNAIMSTETSIVTKDKINSVYAIRPNTVTGTVAKASIMAKGRWK